MRVMVKVYYDGRNYFGYQRQLDVLTVEGTIIDTLTEIAYIEDPRLNKFQSASRTDRYVNAISNVFAFNTEKEVNLEYINAKVSEDRSIICWAKALVDKDFSPKYSDWKKYWYILPDKSLEGESLPTKEEIRQLSKLFVGNHDFKLFCRLDHRETKREMESIEVYEDEGKTIIEFKANSFLWEQIRRIVAYILNYYKLEEELQDTKKLLTAPKDIKVLNIQPADPNNLILIEHYYKNVKWEKNNKALKDVRERLEEIAYKLETEKLRYSTINKYFQLI